MRKLKIWQMVFLGLLLFMVLSYVGLVASPSLWWVFPAVPVIGFLIYQVSKHGFMFWKTKLEQGQKYTTVLSDKEAEAKIREYCDNEDILIETKSPKEGTWDAKREAGRRRIPFMICKRFVSMSKQFECWALVVCDMSSGKVTVRAIDEEFGETDLDMFLEKWGGPKEYIEKIMMPKHEGAVVERALREPEGEQSG